MVNLFKKLFIKNYTDVKNPIVRATYGVVAGVFGIICNAFLFLLKLLAGILSGSVAVIADAINNLSDFMTSIITLLGFKISKRPADKEHPYGHARFEYVTALIVSCVIFFIGIETGRAGLDKILSGGETDFSVLTLCVLGGAILVKLVMSIIFKGLGKSINSEAITAMGTDSRNDVISSSVVLVSVVVGMFTDFAIDGYLGIAVSLFVLYSAFSLLRETINPLLGMPPEREYVESIKQKLKSYPQVLDIHDLIVHNYGPTKTFATVHIEVDSTVDIMISHDLADNIERDFYRDMGVSLVCHLDPVKVGDKETEHLKKEIIQILQEYCKDVSVHDFRVVVGYSHTNVIFDVVVPFGCDCEEQKINELVCEKLNCYDKKYYAVIEFDRDYSR